MTSAVAVDHTWRPDTFAEVESRGEWKRARHLEWLVDRTLPGLIKGNYRAIINMPPRHGKSLLFSVWLNAWLLRLNPRHRTILTSNTGQWARKLSGQTRSLVTQEALSTDSAAVSDWSLREGGGMIAAGARASIIGRGGHLLDCDDPHKDLEDALSNVQNDRLHSWWDSTLMRRGEPGYNVIVNHSRWADCDLTGWLLKERAEEGWDHIVLPAIAEADDPMGRAEGEALWPEVWPLEGKGKLLHIKATTPGIIWTAQYRQSPQTGSGNIWNTDWFRRWEHETPDDAAVVRPGWVPKRTEGQWIQSWDFAFKDLKTSSFVTGQVWCRKGADCFLVHQVRERASFVRSLEMMKAMCKRYPQATLKLIEDKANGPAIMSQLKHKIGGMVPVEPYGSKVARAIAVTPLMESGNVYVPADHVQGKGWVKDYLTECARFPNAANDDQVDTSSQALSRLQMSGKVFFGVL